MENCKCIFATLFSSLLSVLSPSLSSAENYCASVHNAGRRLELLRTEKGVLKRTGVSLEFGLESAASLRTFPFWKGGLKSLFIISQKPVGRLLGPGWFCAAEAAAAAEINYFVPFPLLLASLMCSFKAFVCTHWTIRSSQNEEEFWISLLFWILPIFWSFIDSYPKLDNHSGLKIPCRFKTAIFPMCCFQLAFQMFEFSRTKWQHWFGLHSRVWNN